MSTESQVAPRIAVVGGGPAGMAAAVSLTLAGCEVTLFEAAAQLGGKVSSWTNGSHSFEHGVHGWWPAYRNFDAVLTAAGISPDRVLRRAGLQALVMWTADGTTKRHLIRRGLEPPAPLHLAKWAIQSGVPLADLLGSLKLGAAVLGYQHQQDFSRLDELSFEDLLAAEAVPDEIQKHFLEPFVRSFAFAEPREVSAAAALAALNFYLVPDGDGSDPRWCLGGPTAMLFDPLAQWIQARGSHVRIGTRVGAVLERDGKVLLQNEPVSAELAYDAVPEGHYQTLSLGSVPVYIGRFKEDLRCLDATCTHMGCTVKPSDSGFECPCHGGQYDSQGQVLRGPPVFPLRRLDAVREGDMVRIHAESTELAEPFDAVIIATDVKAAARLAMNSPALRQFGQEHLRQLRTTPVIVVRLWFDLQLVHELPQSGVFIEPRFADTFFVLNSMAPNYDAEGLVVEVQCYRTSPWQSISDLELVEIARRECAAAIEQDLPAPHHALVQRHSDVFTLLDPGSTKHRPEAGARIGSTYFSGDWTWIPDNAWMMERAVISGLRAASEVCRALGRKPGIPVQELPAETFMLAFARLRARALSVALGNGPFKP